MATVTCKDTESEVILNLVIKMTSSYLSLIGNDEASEIFDKLNENETMLFNNFSEAYLTQNNYSKAFRKNKDELVELNKKLNEVFCKNPNASSHTIFETGQ